MSNEYNNADPAQALDNFSKTIYGTPMPGIGDDDPGQQYLIGPGNGTQGYRTGASMSGSDSGFPWDDDEEETGQEEQSPKAADAASAAAAGAAVGGVAGLVDWTKPYPGAQGGAGREIKGSIDGDPQYQNLAAQRNLPQVQFPKSPQPSVEGNIPAGGDAPIITPPRQQGTGGVVTAPGGAGTLAGNYSNRNAAPQIVIGNPNGDGNGLTVSGGFKDTKLEKFDPLLLQKALALPPKLPKIAVKPHDDDARLSEAVYDNDGGVRNGTIPIGWEPVSREQLLQMGISPESFRNDGSGFFSTLYYNKSTKKYVLAFRGTEMSSLRDWKADGTQATGFDSPQYDQAIWLARKVSQTVGGGNLTYAGHSLGGGLAAAASLVTKVPAVTFNAAAVHDATLRAYNADDKDAQRLITAYHIPGEVVGGLQSVGALTVPGILSSVGKAQGNEILIEPSGASANRINPFNSFPRHMVGQFTRR